jgi:hypothetical protein
MPLLRSAYIDQKKIAANVAKVAKALAPDVVRIRYSFEDDWRGEESMFFRIVLSNAASKPPRLFDVSRQAREMIYETVRPLEQGFEAYFNVRSVSEQATLKDPDWE